MLIKEVRVKNFRSILDETFPCESLTALVGRNGSGKSAFLSALEFFYENSTKVNVEDFYSEDVSKDIEIEITFSELSDLDRAQFSRYINDDCLTVVRVFTYSGGQISDSYHGMPLQNPDFMVIRNAGTNNPIRSKYNEVRGEGQYSSLPTVGSAAAALRELENWESQNPSQCQRIRDDGQFFGFRGVGQGLLRQHSKFILIPAVRDAQSDATEGKGSSVTEIMDLVVRSALANRREITEFKQSTNERYNEIMAPGNLVELTDLQSNLSSTLESYVTGSSISLLWDDTSELSFPDPRARVKLNEDGFESTVERTGHGLQRAFIMTMLQHLIAARERPSNHDDTATADETEGTPTDDAQVLPSLIMAIEEPELYQHPSRQRHIANVLSGIADGEIPGVAGQTQVIYTTHSPLFVGLDRFDQIRLLRKEGTEPDLPRATILKKGNMQELADELGHAHSNNGGNFTAEALRSRLQTLMTPWMNEGFFADTVVLVEGEDDRAAILGMAEYLDVSFDSEGIAVIPCGGKNNLDRPLVIFRQLGIPIYVVWDSDYSETNTNVKQNRALLALMGETVEDWPAFVGASCACLKVNLEHTLKEEFGGELFGQLLDQFKNELDFQTRDQAKKNVTVLRRSIAAAATAGKVSVSLEGIVRRIIELNEANHL